MAWLMPRATITLPSGTNCATTDRKKNPMRTIIMMMVIGSISIISVSMECSMSAVKAASPVT